MTRWSDFFATSYAEARAGFLAACERDGATLKAHRHPRPGPGGEAIHLDEARFGESDARRIFFLLSGTHGIEGFCGSGIQRSPTSKRSSTKGGGATSSSDTARARSQRPR